MIRELFEGHAKIPFFRHSGSIFVYTEEEDGNIKIWTLGFFAPQDSETARRHPHQRSHEGKDQRLHAVVDENQCHWTRQVEVQRRMVHSVCLNTELKARLQGDLEEYLHESSAGWYASRNIPYRRDYLLYGQSGCGKISFAMSVAGEFKLSIYSISLLNKSLTHTRL